MHDTNRAVAASARRSMHGLSIGLSRMMHDATPRCMHKSVRRPVAPLHANPSPGLLIKGPQSPAKKTCPRQELRPRSTLRRARCQYRIPHHHPLVKVVQPSSRSAHTTAWRARIRYRRQWGNWGSESFYAVWISGEAAARELAGIAGTRRGTSRQLAQVCGSRPTLAPPPADHLVSPSLSS